MKREYAVIVDSMADFNIGYSDPDLVIVETPVYVGDFDYTNASPNDFYEKQRQVFELNVTNKERPKIQIRTSTPNPHRIEEEMKKILQRGKDAIYVSTASSLTAAFTSGMSAVDIIHEEFPMNGHRAIVIDGLSMSALTSILVTAAMDQCETTDSFLSFIFNRRNDTEHFFAINDWEAFKNSGRISKNTLLIAKMTGIKPLMRFDYNEHVERVAFCEKKNRSFRILMEYAARRMVDTIDPMFPTCTIIHADNFAGAEMLYNAVKAVIPDSIKVDYDPQYGRMGPATGVHLGFSAVGLGFIRKKNLYPNAEMHRKTQDPTESIYGAEDYDD